MGDNVAKDTTCASQVSSLQQKLEMQGKDYESRLLATENMNKDAMNELRDMLSTQQKKANKWREESRATCQKLETSLNKITRENGALKRKNEELTLMNVQNQKKIEEMEKEYSENQTEIEKLKTLHSSTQERIENSGAQIQGYLNREKQLQKEKKALNREIDKL